MGALGHIIHEEPSAWGDGTRNPQPLQAGDPWQVRMRFRGIKSRGMKLNLPAWPTQPPLDTREAEPVVELREKFMHDILEGSVRGLRFAGVNRHMWLGKTSLSF